MLARLGRTLSDPLSYQQDGLRIQLDKRALAVADRRRWHEPAAVSIVEDAVDWLASELVEKEAVMAMTEKYAHLAPEVKRDAVGLLDGRIAAKLQHDPKKGVTN